MRQLTALLRRGHFKTLTFNQIRDFHRKGHENSEKVAEEILKWLPENFFFSSFYYKDSFLFLLKLNFSISQENMNRLAYSQ